MILQENMCMSLSNLFGQSCMFVFVWYKLFLTEIIICSFNIALKKCANGKAFYIVVTVRHPFFCSINLRMPGSFNIDLPHSQDKFQIYVVLTCTCLVWLLVNFSVFCMFFNFTGFRRFLRNLQLCYLGKYQKPRLYN